MVRTAFVVAAVAGLAAGCGYDGYAMPEPVEISGTVAYADGRPVRDVQLVLRPRGEGHPAGGPVGPDGSFAVRAVPGEFMFYFQPLERAKDRAKARTGFAAVPAAYRDVTVDHTATLAAGGGNRITLE